jgi:phospholipid/cholesterol/gamma-HCH transport system substrate-binding protein
VGAGLFPRPPRARRAAGRRGNGRTLTLETRASHILIGSVVLLSTFAFFGFAIWLAQIDLDREVRLYDIPFFGSVAGLGVGGDVRYRGIKIGSVTDIVIDPDDPARVLATVEIDGETPIREGDVASLQLQGITGVAYVNIDGARAGSEPLTAAEGRQRPVIPSRRSEIERLFAGAPELLNRAISVTERLAEVLDEDNQQSISGILADLKTVTGALAGDGVRIESILVSLESSAADIAQTMQEARRIAGRMDGVLDDATETLAVGRGALAGIDQVVTHDAGALIAELRATNLELYGIAETFSGVVADNEEQIESFATDGLGETQRLITEARLLIASLARVVERLETDGAQSLFGVQGAVEERGQ